MRLALLVLLAAAPAFAAEAPKKEEMDEKTRLQVVHHVLDTPLNEVDPTIAKAFLAMDLNALPKKLRDKARGRKIEIETVVKLHETKKKGFMLQTDPGCKLETGLKPRKEIGFYKFAGYEEIEESEELALSEKTQCTETDMVCQFSLMIFRDSPKGPRTLMLHVNDPLMAILGGLRNKDGAGAQTNFFGKGAVTCMH